MAPRNSSDTIIIVIVILTLNLILMVITIVVGGVWLGCIRWAFEFHAGLRGLTPPNAVGTMTFQPRHYDETLAPNNI